MFRDKRIALTSDEKEKLNAGILQQFKKVSFPSLQFVHSFISSEKLGEPDTSQLIKFLKLQFQGLAIVAPKVDWNSMKMENILLQDENLLEQNRYGIDEPPLGVVVKPEEIDMVIVPLLAFDKSGFRVGYGKGFYDRFLKECRKDTLRIGISFFNPIKSIEDKDEFDISLTHCCTSDQLYFWQ